MPPEEMMFLPVPAAWREIARRIAEGEWAGWGLCNEIRHLYCENRLAAGIMEKRVMQEQVDKHIEVMVDVYELGIGSCYLDDEEGLWDADGNHLGPVMQSPERADNRVLFALFLALEAEEYG